MSRFTRLYLRVPRPKVRQTQQGRGLIPLDDLIALRMLEDTQNANENPFPRLSLA